MYPAHISKFQLRIGYKLSNNSSRVPRATVAVHTKEAAISYIQSRPGCIRKKRRSWSAVPCSVSTIISGLQICCKQPFIESRRRQPEAEAKKIIPHSHCGNLQAYKHLRRGHSRKVPKLLAVHALASGSKRKQSDLKQPNQLGVNRDASTGQLNRANALEPASSCALQRALSEKNAHAAASAFKELQADQRKLLSARVCNSLLQCKLPCPIFSIHLAVSMIGKGGTDWQTDDENQRCYSFLGLSVWETVRKKASSRDWPRICCLPSSLRRFAAMTVPWLILDCINWVILFWSSCITLQI